MRCATFTTIWAAPTQWGASSNAYTFLTYGPEVGSCTAGQLVVVTQAEWSAVASVAPGAITPYDYTLGGAFWAFGFTGVMIMYFSAHAIGLVLKAVRKF